MGDVSFGVVAVYGGVRFRALDPLGDSEECIVGIVCDGTVVVLWS